MSRQPKIFKDGTPYKRGIFLWMDVVLQDASASSITEHLFLKYFVFLSSSVHRRAGSLLPFKTILLDLSQVFCLENLLERI